MLCLFVCVFLVICLEVGEHMVGSEDNLQPYSLHLRVAVVGVHPPLPGVRCRSVIVTVGHPGARSVCVVCDSAVYTWCLGTG